jgi:hypothetical protein
VRLSGRVPMSGHWPCGSGKDCARLVRLMRPSGTSVFAHASIREGTQSQPRSAAILDDRSALPAPTKRSRNEADLGSTRSYSVPSWA